MAKIYENGRYFIFDGYNQGRARLGNPYLVQIKRPDEEGYNAYVKFSSLTDVYEFVGMLQSMNKEDAHDYLNAYTAMEKFDEGRL